MKRISTLVILLLAAMAACKKTEDTTTTPVTTLNPKTDSIHIDVAGYYFTDIPMYFIANRNQPLTSAYLWDFGDGTTSNEEDSILHTYKQPGTYTVTFTYEKNTVSKTITITEGWKKISDVRVWERLLQYNVGFTFPDTSWKTTSKTETYLGLNTIDANTVLLLPEVGTVFNDTLKTVRDNMYLSPFKYNWTKATDDFAEVNWNERTNTANVKRVRLKVAAMDTLFRVIYTSK